MKFRKKPIVIEAEQYNFNQCHPDGVCFCDGKPGLAHIHTLEGMMHVSEGDWVITGIKGEKYPCKPDIFESTYEPVWEGRHDQRIYEA